MAGNGQMAASRFGYGLRADEAVPEDGKAWLKRQFTTYEPRPAPIAAASDRRFVAGVIENFKEARRLDRQAREGAVMKPEADSDGFKAARQDLNAVARAQMAARIETALASSTSFAERLVHFWANHFAISTENAEMRALGGLMEFEAVRPHLFGRFGDMLLAVEHHPAMLMYLNQDQSVGPNSVFAKGRPMGRRQHLGLPAPVRVRGLNENLGREILELHTLGVGSGYTQTDVTEFARVLTGFGVVGSAVGAQPRLTGSAAPGDFVFIDRIHEPGVRTLLGKHYGQQGEEQANAILDDLAVHPATAAHLSLKLARHFVADDPPPALVARLTRAFRDSGGDLKRWYAALIDAPEAWEKAAKFKTPWDWLLSAGRAANLTAVPRPLALINMVAELGQPIWYPRSPAGYGDTMSSWAAPDALMRRVEAAPRLMAMARQIPDARIAAPRVLGGALRAETVQQIARAESPQQAMSLFVLSPEFMRR